MEGASVVFFPPHTAEPVTHEVVLPLLRYHAVLALPFSPATLSQHISVPSSPASVNVIFFHSLSAMALGGPPSHCCARSFPYR